MWKNRAQGRSTLSSVPLAPRMVVGYVVKDAKNGKLSRKETAVEFDAKYHVRLLEKAWEVASFVF